MRRGQINLIIGGLNIRVESEKPLRATPEWGQFRGSFSAADLRYSVCFSPCPPAVSGACSYRSDCLRISQDGRLRSWHVPTMGGAVTAVAELLNPAHFRITVSEQFSPWGETVGDLLSQYAFPECFPGFGRFLFHCAYLLDRGEAVLFTAPSGTGKTTQAELWKKIRGSQIINGDRAVLSLEGNGVSAHGLPFSGSSEDCRNVSAPVRAIIYLTQAKENHLFRLSGLNAVKRIMSGGYLPPEFSGCLPKLLDLAAEIALRVPVYELDCLPDSSAVELLASELE